MATGHNRPLVVGIAGGSASGKTMLATRLTGALGEIKVETIHMDRYFHQIKPKTVAPYTRVVYDDYNQPASFDLARLVRDLDGLLAGPDGPRVVIIEGLLTLYDDAIRSRLDLAIYLDAQSDERIVRRLRRNMERGMDFDEIADYYLDSVRYRHQEYVEPSRWHADIVLNGANTSERGVEAIVAWILGHRPTD